MCKDHIIVCDSRGVIYQGRTQGIDRRKAEYAVDTPHRTLAEAIVGADIFLGVSGPGLLSPQMVETMAAKPLILALANPVPEILPEEARKVRPDAVIATGRSDYPNQVNNVLCFPYIFRGALDVGATTINEEMKLAAVQALADLTMAPVPDKVASAYGGQLLSFGPDYLIPKPFDLRLILELPVAVARAAMDSGVASRPIQDFDAYRDKLSKFVYRTRMVMKPIFERAKSDRKRVIYAEGEEERVLRAVQMVLEQDLAEPILIGRRRWVENRINSLGLKLKIDQDFQLIDPFNHVHYEECWRAYHRLRERYGVDPSKARIRINTRTTALGAMLVHLGYADVLLCGIVGSYQGHLQRVVEIMGLREGVRTPAAMQLLITPKGNLFICDSNINPDPSAEEVAAMTLLAAEEVRHFGITPKVALLSYANFGSWESPRTRKMADALELIRQQAPELEAEGEMQGDAALSEDLLKHLFPHTRLKGTANLLIMPNLEAANIAFNLLKAVTDGVSVGPIMLGLDYPAHILNRTAVVRGIVNMTALAVVDAQIRAATAD